MRVQLANEVASLINDFGPQLYDDFDQVSTFCFSIRKSSVSSRHAFSYPRQRHLRPASLVCGAARAALEQWMLKVLD